MVNIKDVAKRADASVASVSRVINKVGYVSEELKNKILEAMKELNYQPNTIARSLRSNKTNTIGLIIPNSSDPIFAEISKIIQELLFKENFNLVLCNSEYTEALEEKCLDVLISSRVDGIIIIPIGQNSSKINKITDNGTPVIVLERLLDGTNCPAVITDNYQGGYDLAEYLIKLGHRKIGYLDRPVALPHNIERLAGIRRAFEKNRIKFKDDFIIKSGFDFKSGYIAMEKLLNLDPTITAVAAFGDIPAIGAIRHIFDRGLFVPENISVVGFDDISYSNYNYPRLTTVHTPKRKIATTACTLLFDEINNSKGIIEKEEISIRPRIIVRESTQKNINNE